MEDETLTHGSIVVINADEAVILETVYGRPLSVGDVISLEVIDRGTHLVTVKSRSFSCDDNGDSKTTELVGRVI